MAKVKVYFHCVSNKVVNYQIQGLIKHEYLSKLSANLKDDHVLFMNIST